MAASTFNIGNVEGQVKTLTDQISTIGTDLVNFITTIRAVYTTSSISAGGDVQFTDANVISAATIPTGYQALGLVPEGVRPNNSWNCKPQLFYNDSVSKWMVHNNGTSADTATVTFGLILIRSAYRN